MPRLSISDQDRFWKKVSVVEDGCWLWLGSFKQHPRSRKATYGVFHRNGKSECAHRVSWEFSVGAVTPNRNVLHRCDTPACVNPNHLFLGTQADNVRDMTAKGRARKAKGSQQGASKLTEAKVIEIRKRYRPRSKANGYGNAGQLAAEYGVDKHTIARVAKKTWRHVS